MWHKRYKWKNMREEKTIWEEENHYCDVQSKLWNYWYEKQFVSVCVCVCVCVCIKCFDMRGGVRRAFHCKVSLCKVWNCKSREILHFLSTVSSHLSVNCACLCVHYINKMWTSKNTALQHREWSKSPQHALLSLFTKMNFSSTFWMSDFFMGKFFPRICLMSPVFSLL